MGSRRTTTVLGLVAVAMVAAGCSDTTPGSPTATGQAPSASSAPERNGAPRVDNPLDTTMYVTQPCTAISPELLPGLDLPTKGKPDTDSAVARAGAPSCAWDNSKTGTGGSVAFLTKFKNGLADWYRAHQRGEFDGYWEETTVEGYPAVFANSTDARPKGFCSLYVGVSNTLMASVQSLGRLKERSCDHAKQAATAMVKTMKGEG